MAKDDGSEVLLRQEMDDETAFAAAVEALRPEAEAIVNADFSAVLMYEDNELWGREDAMAELCEHFGGERRTIEALLEYITPAVMLARCDETKKRTLEQWHESCVANASSALKYAIDLYDDRTSFHREIAAVALDHYALYQMRIPPLTREVAKAHVAAEAEERHKRRKLRKQRRSKNV